MTSSVWAKALKREGRLACKLIAKAVEALGAGVASAVNVVDVEAVILGGGLGVRLGQPYADKIANAMLPHLFNDHRPRLCWSPRSATSPERSVPACSHPPLRRPPGSRSAQDRSICDAASSTVEKQ
jgi:predicted NBD/HSP70 family sugar kinase